MSMIKTILENSIKDKIGHKPSNKEFASALEYLKDSIREKTDLTDVEVLLLDWKHDCCIQCAGCGDYFLADEMHTNDYGDWFCSRDCELDFAQEKEYDSEHKRELQSMWNER